MDTKLKISTKLTEEDLIRFNYYSFYSKPMMIFITAIGIIMLILVFHYTFIAQNLYDTFPIVPLIFGTTMTILMPIFIYWNAKRSYHSNARFTENISYTFDEVWMELKGQSFESKLTWDKLHKVVETKSWFLIYSSKLIANILPKKDMSAQDTIALRKLIKAVPRLKSLLKSG